MIIGTGPMELARKQEEVLDVVKAQNSAITDAHFGKSVYRMQSCRCKYGHSFPASIISPENKKTCCY